MKGKYMAKRSIKQRVEERDDIQHSCVLLHGQSAVVCKNANHKKAMKRIDGKTEKMLSAAVTVKRINNSPAFAGARFLPYASEVTVPGISIGAEMYNLMMADPGMRARGRTKKEFNASDVPLINAGYF